MQGIRTSTATYGDASNYMGVIMRIFVAALVLTIAYIWVHNNTSEKEYRIGEQNRKIEQLQQYEEMINKEYYSLKLNMLREIESSDTGFRTATREQRYYL
ncbi:MAG: hypothetical protein K9K75_03350 [Deltaproteobacteria bacterium]|nr:hypothetical protein [Deltaproteobacteria bacterium]